MSRRGKATRSGFTVAVLVAALALAAGAESVADRVSSLLLRFPAESASERDAAADVLIGLGRPAVAELCSRLAAPGRADDSLVRFALDAMAVRAGRPGAESGRRTVVEGILEALKIPRDRENAVFLISLLQGAGRAEIIRPLSRLLVRPDLSGPAVRALTATGLPEAAAAFLDALGKARGAEAVAILRGLGALRSRKATPALIALAGSEDPDIRTAALDALADIGDPAARKILERVPVASPAAERAAAAPRLLLYARRMAEEGRKSEASAIARSFLSAFAEPGEEHLRAAALTLFVEASDDAAGLAALLEAAGSPAAGYRQKALDLAAGPPARGSAEDWLALLDRAAPDVQADVIRMLARRGETAALPAVRERLRSGEGAVRREAAVAAARLGGEAVLDEIVPLFRSSVDGEAAAAKKAALLFSSDALIPRLAGVLSSASPAGQAALLEIFAERRMKSLAGAVFLLSQSPDESVRAAALTALEQTVSADDAAAAVSLLRQATSPAEVALLQAAVVAAALQVPDPQARAFPILEALAVASGPRRIDLLRPLAKIGGTAALDAVRADVLNPDPRVQAVAVFTLAGWPDESALPDLFRLARTATDKKTRYLALQGIARLVPASSAPPVDRLKVLSDALEAAVEADEKAVVLDGFAAARLPEGLETLVGCLDDPALRDRAARAVLRLVMPATGYEGLAGMTAAVALKKAVPFVDYEFDRIPAERRAEELLDREGFRPLFNGKDLSGWKGLAADPPRRARMTAGKFARAQAEADASMRAHWSVADGLLLFDGKGENLCTTAEYADFEMFVDWRIEPGGDSGIYLRGSPQVQIWDPEKWPEGSGGLYNNETHPNKPSVRADRPAGEWNTFYIKMTGERVTVDLNGVRVVDGVPMEGYWERGKPIDPSGPIELQAHGTPLAFKNIRLRDLTIFPDGIR